VNLPPGGFFVISKRMIIALLFLPQLAEAQTALLVDIFVNSLL
jgi:hypothetical protein